MEQFQLDTQVRRKAKTQAVECLCSCIHERLIQSAVLPSNDVIQLYRCVSVHKCRIHLDSDRLHGRQYLAVHIALSQFQFKGSPDDYHTPIASQTWRRDQSAYAVENRKDSASALPLHGLQIPCFSEYRMDLAQGRDLFTAKLSSCRNKL